MVLLVFLQIGFAWLTIIIICFLKYFFFFHLKVQKLSYEILQFEVGEMKILT